MGIRTPVSSNYAITLGGLKQGVTALDLAHAYETFATGGVLVSGTLGAGKRGPVGIRKVTMRDSHRVRNRNKRIQRRVLPKNVAETTTSILESVVNVGTGKVAQLGGVRAWGKTGTTENYGDAWFAGATDKLTVAVWVGYPNGLKPMTTEYQGVARRRRHVPRAHLARLHDRRDRAEKQRQERACEADQKKLDEQPDDPEEPPPPPPASCVRAGLATDPSESPAEPAAPGGTQTTSTTPADPATTDATPRRADPGAATPNTDGGVPAAPQAPPAVPPAVQPPAAEPEPEPESGGASPSGGGAAPPP